MSKKQLNSRLQQQIAWGILLVATLVYAVEMSHQAVLRYDTFKATAFDLGNLDQVIWNTLHGRLFQYTNQAVDWYGPPTRLAQHFEPIILLLSLLYAFHADPRILLVFQTLVLVTGAFPVFLLTHRYLPQWPLLAAMMAIAYLLSPALLGLNIFDFHPISLATPLLLYAVLALTYKRYVWFVLACILAAACKEDVPLTIAMLGLFVIWQYKLPRLGLALTLGGLLWSFLAFVVIIPHFYPGVQSNNFWYRYEALGSSPAAAIVNLLLHPWLLFTTFVTLDRFYYLVNLFRSTGFLCLLAPEWLLLALPNFLENLLSTDPLIYSGVYQYNAAIIPFLMLSSIHGLRRLMACWQHWRGEPSEQASATDAHAGQASGFGRLLARGLSWSAQRLPPLLQLWNRIVARCVQVWTLLVGTVSRQWQRFSVRMLPLAAGIPVARLQWMLCAWVLGMLLLNYAIMMPWLNGFWADHEPGSREQHIQHLLAMIPPDASIAAGSNLNPHVSERQRLAVFPSISDSAPNTADTVQYIIVDLNAIFPEDRATTVNKINQLVHSGQYREIARAEGVVLLVLRSTA